MRDKTRMYIHVLIGICILILAFHLLILFKVIPYEITWGGKLKNDEEMYVFELISITINAFLLYVLFQKGNYVKIVFGEKTISVILWIFFALFAINTAANLFAATAIEKSFSLLTLLMAVLIWLINKAKTR